jgi:hypothetical protein
MRSDIPGLAFEEGRIGPELGPEIAEPARDAPFTNSRDELKALFDAGVDGIWADFPATAVEVRGGE